MDNINPQGSFSGPPIRPGTVMNSRRYDPCGTVTAVNRAIHPGTFAFREEQDERVLPEDWFSFVHPEGKTYFYHPRSRIVTDAWIYTPSIFTRLLHYAHRLFQTLQQQNIVLPQTSELCLELDPLDDPEPGCSYYLIDHSNRTEFWIDGTTTNDLYIAPVTSKQHLKLVLEEHYWRHVEYFPVHLQLSEEVESELKGILLHACADSMSSDLSTSPMAPKRCKEYLNLLETVQTSAVSRGYKNCVIARLWGEFARNRFINLHGERDARLSRDQPLSPSSSQPTNPASTAFLSISNYILFKVPESHLGRLKRLWVDEIAYTEHWQRFVQGIIREWRESVLGSMVILITELMLFNNATSKPFLAVDETQLWVSSVQHATSLIAVILACTSVVVGVLLIRHHRQFEDTHAAEATTFLSDYQHPSYDLQPLATLYAIPFSLFLYSILSLAISLVLFSLHLHVSPSASTSPLADNLVTSGLITQRIVWFLCFFLVATGYVLSTFFSRRSSGIRLRRWSMRGVQQCLNRISSCRVFRFLGRNGDSPDEFRTRASMAVAMDAV